MNVKIYIGEPIEVPGTKVIRINFLSGASVDDELQFDYYPFWPGGVNMPRLSIFKTTRVFSGEVTIDTDPEQQAINYVTAFNLDFNTMGQFNVDRTGSIVTISATNGSDLLNGTITGGLLANITYPPTGLTDFKSIDLYKDENIGFTSKLSDIEKLSNVFTDFTNSFTVPATDNNNNLFKHYYDVDIDNTFNANIRVLAYLEIDSFPLRFGKLQLESIKLKEGRPDSYKITYYGGLLELTDLFEDDTIDRLDYQKDPVTGEEIDPTTPTWNSLSQFDYEWNSTNFINSINLPSFKDGNIITPLIAYANRDWNYGNGDAATDISLDSGAILDTELRPAIRIEKILEAIEVKYGISFTRNFFGKAVFKNLFMWMNNSQTLTQSSMVAITNPLVDTLPPVTNNISLDGAFVKIRNFKYNQGHGTNVERTYFSTWDFFILPDTGYGDVDFKVKFYDELGNNVRTLSKSDLVLGNTLARYVRRSAPNVLDNTEQIDHKIRIEIESDYSMNFTVNFRGFVSYYTKNSSGGTALTILERKESTGNTNLITIYQQVHNLLPKMKVIDFLQGLMKMFKLVIRPITGTQFYVNTLDGYYSDGNILDITDYVDQKEIDIERPLIYRNLLFKYNKNESFPNVEFRKLNDPVSNELGYGDLKAYQPYIENKEELTVELPFDNFIYERMEILYPTPGYGELTNISIGQSISSDDDGETFTRYNAKPVLFYNNGLANNVSTPFKVKFRNDLGTVAYSYIIGCSNDELLDQVTNTINFRSEIDSWHLQEIANTLYLNYWSNWIDTIYSLKQRKFTFTNTILPPRFVEELSLNDRLIIGDQRYKINDYTINLTNGETKFTLFRDIYDNYNNPEPEFNGKVFTASGMYLVDFTKADSRGSYWLYGSFATYDGQTATRVIKLNADGTQDKTFLTNLGGPNSNPFALVTLAPYEDGRLLVGGFFTQYNGTARNRIARLNPNGTLDTTFSIGTGFNSSTERLLLQDDGKILVTGAFSSYNGTTRNRLARLNSDGSLDTTLAVGTGFNNVTLDTFQNEDGSYYVAGYFTQYDGNTANHVVKIGATGAIDNSFSTGSTAFSPGGNNRVIGLLQDPQSSSFFVYGYDFTTYQGATAGRIIKLTETGAKDESFDAGSGFNNSVLAFRWTDEGNLFAGGSFTTYKGISTQKAIILNPNGDIIQTFSQTGLINHYLVGNDVYATESATGQLVKLTTQNTLNVSRTLITFNAASRYFSFNLFSDGEWQVTKIDTGDGTDWIDVLTPSGSGNSSIEIYCEEKASQIPPDVYQPRTLYLKCTSGSIEKWVRVTQNGLEEF